MYDIDDLFAGPGGLDVAARNLGLNPLGYEWDNNAVATRTAAGLATRHGDVRQYGPEGTADVLGGGPPCQTFSIGGTGKGREGLDALIRAVRTAGTTGLVKVPEGLDERTGLVLEPLRWVIEAACAGSPYRAVVLEQVPAVLPIWEAYAEVLRSARYSVATGVLNTEQYGAPQTRKRAVLVARLDAPAALPEATHRKYVKNVARDAGDQRLLPWVTMADVLPERETPFTVISNYGSGGDPKNRGRRAHDEPAFTVTGKISRFRLVDGAGVELPRFSHSEAGRLQGFPADYPWSGADISQQIGNACPVQLATALLRVATQ